MNVCKCEIPATCTETSKIKTSTLVFVVFSNGLTTPQSPKPLVPDICVKTGHNFSNLLPMLGYCEQCSVRVFVGMFF